MYNYTEDLIKYVDVSEIKNVLDLEYYMSKSSYANYIEANFFDFAESFVSNNKKNLFERLLEHFYLKIVDGDYTPSPKYKIIHDLFKLVSKKEDYKDFFDILYNKGYNPEQDLYDSYKGDLVLDLMEEGKFEHVSYLFEKHNYTKEFKSQITYMNIISSKPNFKGLKLFLNSGIEKPEIPDGFFVYGKDNIEEFMLCYKLLENDPYYKKSIESLSDEYKLELIINNKMSENNLKNIIKMTGLNKITDNMFLKIIDNDKKVYNIFEHEKHEIFNRLGFNKLLNSEENKKKLSDKLNYIFIFNKNRTHHVKKEDLTYFHSKYIKDVIPTKINSILLKLYNEFSIHQDIELSFEQIKFNFNNVEMSHNQLEDMFENNDYFPSSNNKMDFEEFKNSLLSFVEKKELKESLVIQNEDNLLRKNKKRI